MGLSPAEVGASSFWQFEAAVRGMAASRSEPAGPRPPTAAEHDANVAKYG